MRAPFMNLLVLPCAGASATMYLRWRRLLPEWIGLVPVELPGRGSRLGDPYVEDFETLVTQLCAEQAKVLEGRYALFGHSMGALLAYGMAQRQRATGGVAPRALFVSASPAPACRDPARFADRDSDAALIADLRRQGGTPEEVFRSDELLRLTLDTLAADYRVCGSFQHRAGDALSVPLHVLAGRHDDVASDRIEAWRREAAGLFTLDWFDGGHFYLRPRERGVIETIVRELTHQLTGARHVAASVA